jgi:hypothetical protein
VRLKITMGNYVKSKKKFISFFHTLLVLANTNNSSTVLEYSYSPYPNMSCFVQSVLDKVNWVYR